MFFDRCKRPWTEVRISDRFQGLGDIRAGEFGEGASDTDTAAATPSYPKQFTVCRYDRRTKNMTVEVTWFESLRKRENTCLSDVLRLAKTLLSAFPGFALCPSGNGNVQMMSVEQWRNDADRGKRSTGRKTCYSATLSTTSLTWTDLGRNPEPHDERPPTDRLSHGKAL
jgi:hypothetical protein